MKLIKTKTDFRSVLFRNLSEHPQNLTLITHNGVFHADEVFTTAFFKLFENYFVIATSNYRLHFGVVDVVRTARVTTEVLENPKKSQDYGIIYDIGCGEFDHHQVGSLVRENSTEDNPLPYAAFGLVWREFAPLIFDENFVQEFDANFVQFIDLQDNGISRNPLSGVITKMTPAWDSFDDMDTQFNRAVKFAEEVLKVYFDAYFSNKRAEIQLENIIEAANGSTVLVFNQYIPYQGYLRREHPEIQYVIFPSARTKGEWNACPVPDKVYFPEEWVTNKPDGMVFLHKVRFIASFNSKTAAIDAVRSLV